VHEPGDRPAQERLGGIHDASTPERGHRLPAASPDVADVVDEGRRAELLGEIE
jgi:hypothetical protein